MGTLLGWLSHAGRHAPVLLPAAALVWAGSVPAAAVAFACCRLAYVLYVGRSLRTAERRVAGRPPAEADAVWRRFRARASWVMDADAAAFAALCLVTHDTLSLPLPRVVPVAAGAVLVAVGLAVKAWAARTLPEGEYFWRSFFVRDGREGLTDRGPYRWLSDPMYTLGYAHAYGIALALLSLPGLVAAAAAQALILALNHAVERRHVERRAKAAAPESSRAS
jgi:protein-S-isoprenylcysteine O-methyltransferase Ste14